MRILIANDDGFHSPGLYHLARVFSQAYEVIVVAPYTEQSGKSRSITYREAMALEKTPLRDLDIPAYRLEGTPADCVRVGLGYILEEPPDLILSGINNGFNTHFDAPYSGTVAATLEGLNYEIPGLAVSCEAEADEALFAYAAEKALELFRQVAKPFLARPLVLNLNVPKQALGGPGVIKRCARTDRFKNAYACVRKEGDIHHIEISGRTLIAVEDSDLSLLKQGYLTLGPLNGGCGEDTLLDLVSEWLPEEIFETQKNPTLSVGPM